MLGEKLAEVFKILLAAQKDAQGVIDGFGFIAQKNQISEENGELITAVRKELNGRGKPSHEKGSVEEEIADVTLTALLQGLILYDSDAIIEWMKKKADNLHRLNVKIHAREGER